MSQLTATFWGMYPVGIYEGSYIYTQLETHPNMLAKATSNGTARLGWHQKRV